MVVVVVCCQLTMGSAVQTHFLPEELQDVHVVLAYALAGLTRGNNFREEVPPLLRPLILHNLHQHFVQLPHEHTLGMKGLGVRALFNDRFDNVVLDPLCVCACESEKTPENVEI